MIDIELVSGAASELIDLHFPAGLPGFPSCHQFQLAPWGRADSPFMLMSAEEDPAVGFVVVSPWVFHPEYDFDLDDATAVRLGLVEATDCVVVCIVTLGDRAQDATVNLLGPIVINRFTREACQAVLPTVQYNVRTPIARPAAA